tara:strand:- start:314 stop:511 length:198 start_codon:yes stop_codon:yes gene_type:complete
MNDETLYKKYLEDILNGIYSRNISFDRYKQLYNKWEKSQLRERKSRRRRNLMGDTDINSKKKGLW